MYHKVIMEYFPKTKQNMLKSLNCLLTLGVKIAHLKTEEGLSSLRKTSSRVPGGRGSLHFITVTNYSCYKPPSLAGRREQATVKSPIAYCC